MSSILQLIEAYCPGLYSDANRDTFINTAQDLVSIDFYGINYNLAVCLMAAHKWAVFNRPGGGFGAVGGLSNLKEGDLSVGYSGGVSGSGYSDLDQTSYGLQLKALKRSTGPGISITGSCVLGT